MALPPHDLGNRIHRVRLDARKQGQFFLADHFRKLLAFLLPSRVGIEHGGSQNLVVFIQHGEGLAEAGHADGVDVMILHRVGKQCKNAVAHFGEIDLVFARGVGRVVFFIIGGKILAFLIKKRYLGAGRADVQTADDLFFFHQSIVTTS